MTPSLTASLARFAATLQYRDIPEAGVARCRAAIIDGTPETFNSGRLIEIRPQIPLTNRSFTVR